MNSMILYQDDQATVIVGDERLYEEPLTITPLVRPDLSIERDEVNWSTLSNEDLQLTMEFFFRIECVFVFDVFAEISERAARGQWIDMDQSPPPLHSLPKIFSVWPFYYLHKQRRTNGGGGER